METKVSYTVVGAFVLSLTIAIVVGVLWLSSGFSMDTYSSYLVYMKESVSGLSVDSQVEYNGVTVGSVEQIKLNNHNPQLVQVILSIKDGTPITLGTSAALTTRGLTGVAFIALKDSSKDLRPLTILPGEKYPIIPSAPSLFARLDTTLSSLSKNFETLTNSLQNLLDKENLHSFKSTLKNIETFTRTLANNHARLNTIFENSARASRQFGPLINSGNTAFDNLQSQTIPLTNNVLQNLDQISKNLSQVSNDLKQNPSALLRGTAQSALGPGE